MAIDESGSELSGLLDDIDDTDNAPSIAGESFLDAQILSPVDTAIAMTKGIPSDPDTMPGGQSQWHLVGTWGLHADDVWNDYTGEGVLVAAMDDGFQYTHAEIAANYRTDLDYDAFANDTDAAPVIPIESHGTSVLGTIIADDNGVGGVGVAFDAEGFGIRIDLHGQGGTVGDMVEGFQYALTSNVDVMNNSWGFSTQFSDTTQINFSGLDFIDIENALIDLVNTGRGGLGTNVVFSAGNSRAAGDNVNYHSTKNTPNAIMVAAIDSDGTYSSFSTPGAALMVSAGGTQVYTTDREGSAGYNTSGDYTNFSGTSAAAPIVAGMVTVLLESNPDLGWRDVREILSYSAQHNDPGSGGWDYNGATNWNGGGLHFSHDYGFGAADLYRAVRLAETWTGQQTSANDVVTAPVASGGSTAIADLGTVTSDIIIAQNIEIETVIVDLNITHARAGDLVVTLVSPDGTESVLINRPENGSFTGIYSFSGIDFETTSNAHRGEESAGTWTLRVQDAAGGNTGTLDSWSISFTGQAISTDDTYFYTPDYANFTGAEALARGTLTDVDGGTDAINLATIATDTILNMNGGTASTIAGTTLNIAGGTVIENAYLGDGDDTVTGNSANNYIYGGRGSDTMDAGAGNDTAGYLEDISSFSFNFINSVTVQITTTIGDIWTDVLTNFENFEFNGDSYTRAQLEVYAGAGSPQTIVGTNGHDTLTGGTANDLINGNAGNDTINGGLGADLLYGDGGFDILYGGDGDDLLDGGAGNDRMEGGLNDDTYVVNSFGDIVVENAGEGNDTVQSSVNYTLGANIENLVLTGASSLRGTGNALDNTITGNAGNNDIDGMAGADTMVGGDGDDTYYVDNVGDTVTENANEGTDTVESSISFTLSANVERLELTGAGNTNGTGNASDNLLIGNSGNNVLDGSTGADRMLGHDGDDTYYLDNTSDVVVESFGQGNDTIYASFNYTLDANVENLVLTGGALTGLGNTLANTITGNSADNVLNGGTGADAMIGGSGNDTYYVDNVGDTVVENTGAGTDIVISTVSYSLSANVENLTLMGSAVTGTGNSSDNILIGNNAANTLNGGGGNDILDGGGGSDTMAGGTGDDTYYVNSGGDVVTEGAGAGTDTVWAGLSYTLTANVENLFLLGSGAFNATGNTLDNTLTGNAGNNIMDGGAGTDTMVGGAGHDLYIVDNTSDIITENMNEGVDVVQASASFTLSANVEHLNLMGSGNINGTGNNLNNIINGNSGDNVLDGGLGADTMTGGLGDDTYVVDDVGDIVAEIAGQGTDTVQSYINYVLAATIENLTLVGAADINGTGNNGSNIITGNTGNNYIDGGAGIDTMIGGAGNDTYIVDNSLDVVIESFGGGSDHIYANMSYILGGNIENLTLTGSGSLSGTGNTLANTITGNNYSNVIDGGAGADTMIGGRGSDIYYVDNVGDVIIEQASGGHDVVFASASHVLGTEVEDLTLTGSGDISGTGNALRNVIVGNSGDNILSGGSNNDVMYGGLGDDIYYVDHAIDLAFENVGEGTDTVRSTVSHTLRENVENLVLLGSSGLNGNGNAGDNEITGNVGNNTLRGYGGNDILRGGDGDDDLQGGSENDILYGGAGADTLSGGNDSDIFVFEAATAFSGLDTITDFRTFQNDALDISDMLTGYDPLADTLTDFVEIATIGSHSALRVDMDGTGGVHSMTQIAIIYNNTTLTDEDALVLSGHLIVV
ncbi:MAG: S8 family serine peptidase [Alphaproteobacteria bacterium]|nr:S8 family serine peptidase [Alphaproteobacteria bacterium]